MATTTTPEAPPRWRARCRPRGCWRRRAGAPRPRAPTPAAPAKAGSGMASTSAGCTRRGSFPTCATTAAACCASKPAAPSRCCRATSAGTSKRGWRAARPRRCAPTCWSCRTTARRARRALISSRRCDRGSPCCRSATTIVSTCRRRWCWVATNATASNCSTPPSRGRSGRGSAPVARASPAGTAPTTRATGAMPRPAAQAMLSAVPQRQR